MSLADDLASIARPPGSKVETIRAAMNDTDREAFDQACLSAAGSRVIAQALARHGIQIGRTALDEYRAGLRERAS